MSALRIDSNIPDRARARHVLRIHRRAGNGRQTHEGIPQGIASREPVSGRALFTARRLDPSKSRKPIVWCGVVDLRWGGKAHKRTSRLERSVTFNERPDGAQPMPSAEDRFPALTAHS
jgi:hypothetical protein